MEIGSPFLLKGVPRPFDRWTSMRRPSSRESWSRTLCGNFICRFVLVRQPKNSSIIPRLGNEL
jgi:hypothetical protein